MSIRYGRKYHFDPEVQERLKTIYENGNRWEEVYKLNCWVCGRVFYCKNYTARNCSYRCTNDGYMERRKRRKLQERGKVCPVCGIQFQAKGKDALCCSPKCVQKKYRDKLRL